MKDICIDNWWNYGSKTDGGKWKGIEPQFLWREHSRKVTGTVVASNTLRFQRNGFLPDQLNTGCLRITITCLMYITMLTKKIAKRNFYTMWSLCELCELRVCKNGFWESWENSMQLFENIIHAMYLIAINIIILCYW